MKFVYKFLLALTLACGLPVRQVRANEMVGWTMAGITVATILWWNIWGKKRAKAESKKPAHEKGKQKCFACQETFKTQDLVNIHPNTKEYLRNNVPNIRMNHRPDYARQNRDFAEQLLKELPKRATHKMCPSCTITHFYNFTTSCGFHYNEGNGHGVCLRCDGKAQCLTCPEIFEEVEVRNDRGRVIAAHRSHCNVRLDIGWVHRNNPNMRIALEKQYLDDYREADRLWDLWIKMTQNYHANRKK